MDDLLQYLQSDSGLSKPRRFKHTTIFKSLSLDQLLHTHSFIPLLSYLPKAFINQTPDSPITKWIWTEIIYLSFYRQRDRDHLYELHTNPIHHSFLNAVSRFHIYQSQIGRRWNWIGGISLSSSSLSNELISIREEVSELSELYQHHANLITGQFQSLFDMISPCSSLILKIDSLSFFRIPWRSHFFFSFWWFHIHRRSRGDGREARPIHMV